MGLIKMVNYQLVGRDEGLLSFKASTHVILTNRSY